MKLRIVVLACIIAGCFAACGPVQTPAAILDRQEQVWRDQQIAAYRIEVLEVRSIWHAQTHRITVRNNQVENASASCIPAPIEAGTCEVEAFIAADYTIPGVFARARTLLNGPNAEWAKITYDPTYGFPATISYNHPDIVDEDWGWRISSFEVIK
jgi:hypothetical protein